MRKKRVYIAGAISGDKNFKIKFGIAERELREAGHIVLNPASLPQAVKGKTYRQYIDDSHKMLIKADAIFMLPGWQTSRGACLEFLYGWICGLEILEVNRDGVIQEAKRGATYFKSYTGVFSSRGLYVYKG
ncbi:MAG: DUF4406 domain-containing protein [Elusimicrobiota bacterium]|jgi:hypothetical protein|nr:DUF4406 domain-containing protein [Elusimicrobiota bacterium]